VAEFIDRHSDRWVRVQSPNVANLREALQSRGAEVAPVDESTIEVRGVTTAEVGEIAAARSVVLHELSTQTGSLEDAFLKATAAAQEYTAGPVPT
jgi:ABC-2 type transport system ATP-binding protein